MMKINIKKYTVCSLGLLQIVHAVNMPCRVPDQHNIYRKACCERNAVKWSLVNDSPLSSTKYMINFDSARQNPDDKNDLNAFDYKYLYNRNNREYSDSFGHVPKEAINFNRSFILVLALGKVDYRYKVKGVYRLFEEIKIKPHQRNRDFEFSDNAYNRGRFDILPGEQSDSDYKLIVELERERKLTKTSQHQPIVVKVSGYRNIEFTHAPVVIWKS